MKAKELFSDILESYNSEEPNLRTLQDISRRMKDVQNKLEKSVQEGNTKESKKLAHDYKVLSNSFNDMLDKLR